MCWVRHHSLISAIHMQVQLLKHCLTNQNFVAEHKSFIKGSPSVNDHSQRSHCINSLFTPICIFDYALVCRCQVESLNHVGRQNRANCAGINQRVGFVNMNLLLGQLPAPRQRLVCGVN